MVNAWFPAGWSRLLRVKPLLAALACCLLLAGCNVKYPETRTDAVDERPTLIVANASDTAVLWVNGVELGAAKQYDGAPGVLRLTPGSHTIEVRDGGAVIHQENMYLADAMTRTVSLPSR